MIASETVQTNRVPIKKRSPAWAKIKRHKRYVMVIVLVLLAGGYFAYARARAGGTDVQYVTAAATKGMIASSVAGSGNVTVGESANVNPSVSGTITNLAVRLGDNVKKGQVLFDISNDQLDVNTSKSYGSYLQAEQSLTSANAQLQQAQYDLDNASGQAGAVATANIQALQQKVVAAQAAVNTATPSQLESARAQLLQAQSDLAKAQQQSQAASENLGVLSQKVDAAQASVTAAAQNVNTTSADYQNQLATANQRTVTAPIDGTITTLNVQEGNTVGQSSGGTSSSGSSAQSSGGAGSGGSAGGSSGSSGSNGSSGSSGATTTSQSSSSSSSQAAVVIQNLGSLKASVQISEVDIYKVAPGQKVSLVFDAVENLTLTGKVEKIDVIGSVSSGVVNYNVTIGLDTSDARLKPGMSVSATVTTAVKQDVLTVPNAAVKTQGTSHYVEILQNGAPRQQTVTIGLTNDTSTEIMSGLSEGDAVITQTINPNAAAGQTSQPSSGLGGLGGSARPSGAGGGGGGIPRAGGG